MADKEEMIKQILHTVRSDQSLWPKEYTKQQSENYLQSIELLVGPSLNSAGVTLSEEEYKKAKDWARQVLDLYISKNPFQGAFVKPMAVSMFETLDKMWAKRSNDTQNGSWL